MQEFNSAHVVVSAPYLLALTINHMSKKIENARWATKEEIDKFYNYLSNQKNFKNDITNNWLSTNGAKFIADHKSFYADYLSKINDKKDEYYLVRKAKYYTDLQNYERLKNNLGLCKCRGNLRYKKMDTYEFIGCENYKEQGYDHVKVYPPYEPSPPKYETILELSSNYLFNLKQLYGYPKQLKESILYEYLIMNNIDTYVDLSAKYQMLPDIQRKSKKRENIIKPILDCLFDSVYFQMHIKIKYEGEKEKLIIPDFICKRGNKMYVIEQKKSIENIDNGQVNEYMNALKFIAESNKQSFIFETLFIIEQGEPDIDNKIYTIDTIAKL
jgi:ssDNA-binding Zn-finger/Zn-ribbon topoisomerase 1